LDKKRVKQVVRARHVSDVYCKWARAQTVKVQLDSNKPRYLSLAEVQVYASLQKPKTLPGDIDANTYYIGSTMGKHCVKRIDYAEECADLCAKKSGCISWSYKAVAAQCCLKNKYKPKPRFSTKWVSGVTKTKKAGAKPVRIHRNLVFTTKTNILVKRMRVVGNMTSSQLQLTCRAAGLVPVCDSPREFNGGCVIVDSLSWTSSKDAKANAIPYKLIEDIFTYANSKTGRALHETAKASLPATSVDVDGDTLCALDYRARLGDSGTFTVDGYSFSRIRVVGSMSASNIKKACQDARMFPVCDSSKYADGNCYAMPVSEVGKMWSFSNPTSATKYKFPLSVFFGAFFYSGTKHKNASRLNLRGISKPRWSTSTDHGADTICVIEKICDLACQQRFEQWEEVSAVRGPAGAVSGSASGSASGSGSGMGSGSST